MSSITHAALLIGRRLQSGRYGAAGTPLIHKLDMTLIGVQWSAAADKHPRCPDKGATYVGNRGCGSFYALSFTSVLTPIASKIFWPPKPLSLTEIVCAGRKFPGWRRSRNGEGRVALEPHRDVAACKPTKYSVS